MSRSASAAPRSPATVVKRANISVFLPTALKIFARVYRVMSLVTVNVPKAPEPLACMRRSGMISRLRLASFSISHTSCISSGPRGPAVMLFWLSTTGAPKAVVNGVLSGLSVGLLMVRSFVASVATRLGEDNDQGKSFLRNDAIVSGYHLCRHPARIPRAFRAVVNTHARDTGLSAGTFQTLFRWRLVMAG